MNAVEIEQAISNLSQNEFDPVEFPYAFLQAFGNKETTLKRLRSGSSNKSDLGGVLQANHIHLLIANKGEVSTSLAKLKDSPATTKSKARFILATDGFDFEAEDNDTGETVACSYEDFPDHFGFFLPLAGISTIQQLRESSFDIRATSRLNRLYVTLLNDNPDWGSAERRSDMNHFMARLIFCFFAEDTEIFCKKGLFSDTVAQMSERDSSNTHEVISELFRAMNTKRELRSSEGIPRWADVFPYVNGGLFSGTTDTPKFSKIARNYLIHTGNLDWTKINPDIFGSMIQAVTDDEERGSLGMHYTSVPNILKVLNPLFLDDLRAKLEEAGANPRTLLNLRKRISRIRVFDPACGSGNFLVIAYKQMREIENTINERRSESGRKSDIPLTNFRGIELREFPAEVARLALIIAEYQCDLLYRGQKEALQDFLPLSTENWIVCGNALRKDWKSICPIEGAPINQQPEDLFTTSDVSSFEFSNEGGETYICGNPPYLGSKWQSDEQKSDLKYVFDQYSSSWKSLDYVAGWFLKAAEYGKGANCQTAFVSTNSVCQGLQVQALWELMFNLDAQITFAYSSFTWSNLASNNAGVTVAIIGFSSNKTNIRKIYTIDEEGNTIVKSCDYINAYLVAGPNVIVSQQRKPIAEISQMLFGNMPRDGGFLILSTEDKDRVLAMYPEISKYFRPYLGSEELTHGKMRWCVWVDEKESKDAESHPYLKDLFDRVRDFRLGSNAESTRSFAAKAYRFVQIAGVATAHTIAISKVSTERRKYLPVDLFDARAIVSDLLFAMYDAPIWNLSIVASQLHRIWIATVCGKMRIHYRYSNTLGWNTFPMPKLTEKNIADLTKCAEDILLARELHFPATISDLYDPDTMPQNLREAHERNDEVLERIYIGRCFRNDTERLEKLFGLYTQMSSNLPASNKKAKS